VVLAVFFSAALLAREVGLLALDNSLRMLVERKG